MLYREKPKPIREIANELGVESVVEWSVRRAGDDLRITVQLINGETERSLWTNTYNRRYSATNMFAIQADIARQVSRELQVQLTGAEEERLDEVLTENDAAYELYVRAAYYRRLSGQRADEQEADLLRRSVALDPGFAAAWGGLARALIWFYGNYRVFDVGEEAVAALARAEELAPGTVETLIARGTWEYFAEFDIPAALRSFRRALERKPSDSEIYTWIALAERRAGNWEAALEAHREALRLDPLSPLALRLKTYTDMRLGDFE